LLADEKSVSRLQGTTAPHTLSPNALKFSSALQRHRACHRSRAVGSEPVACLDEGYGRPIAILADLQGPKLRRGRFATGSAQLKTGQAFRFDLDLSDGDDTRVNLPHPEIFAALKPGSTLLVNDGKVRLEVVHCGSDFADYTVAAGGPIGTAKGGNVPDVLLPLAALSDKDCRDLAFACELGVDWLALSFVQRCADVIEARELAQGRAALRCRM